MGRFELSTPVLVSGHTPTMRANGDFVGCVVDNSCQTGVVIVVDGAGKRFQVGVDDIKELVRMPIDERNVASDWIIDDMLDWGSSCGREFLGWWKEKPVHCIIDISGALFIHLIHHSEETLAEIENYIVENFDMEPNAMLVTQRQYFPNGLLVTFYSTIN